MREQKGFDPRRLLRTTAYCAVAAVIATMGTALAASADQAEDSGSKAEAKKAEAAAPMLEEIVVTGTSRTRSVYTAPNSVTLMDEQDLARYSFNSQADILRNVPGIRAEGGGGEVAANVFIRGMPSGGQFQFTPLEYDGIPAFSTFGLNSSAFDVYYRNDLGIERLEFVRGGVSNLFGPGSVAGIINYISITGSDTPQNTVQVETGSPTEGPSAFRFRTDFLSAGPLDSDKGLYYAISGYYRYDEGPIKTGFPTQGFQLRANIKKEFSDGSGSFRLVGQVINDDVQFFLPFPLDGETRKRAIGNDGKRVFTVQTDDANFLSFDRPDGRYRTRIRHGVRTEGGAIGFILDKDLDEDWSLNVKGKYARYSHEFNLFLDGDGFVNVPETLSSFLQARGLPGIENATFTFTESGEPVPADALLFANRILDRLRPANDFTMEANVKRNAVTGEVDHTITIGGFFSRAEADDEDTVFTYLGEFANRPRLVDLKVTMPGSGEEIYISQNGLLDAGTSYSNAKRTATRFAGYIADQMVSGPWSFDVGLRVERIIGDLLVEKTGTFQISDDPMLSAALRDVVFGTGDFLKGRVHTTAWAAAAAALYEVNENLNLFANFSRGFFFPQLRGVRFDPNGNPAPYEAEIIKQSEVGAKFQNPLLSATITGFWVKLSNRQDIRFINAPGGGVINVANLVGTRTFGVEATAEVYLHENLTFQANATFQDHQFTSFQGMDEFVGNELPRQPKVFVNAGLVYDDGHFDLAIFNTFQGRDFSSNANNIRLDGFNLTRLEAGYRFQLGDGQSLRASFAIFNLFNSDGITEGSPRVGESQTAAGQFFVGRPILPRQFTFRLRYDF